MKIDEIKVGEVYEIDGQDKDGQPITVQYEILEVGMYPTPIDPLVFFHGAKVRTGDKEGILNFLLAEFLRKVE